MKKILLIAVLLIGTIVTAQEKSAIGVFRGNENSYGLELTSNYDSIILGVGASHAVNSPVDNNLGVFALAGYQWNELRLVSRLGAANYPVDGKTFTYGGYAGIQVSKKVAFNVGYDTNNKYTTGLTFTLN